MESRLDLGKADIDVQGDAGKLYKKYGFKQFSLKQRFTNIEELVCNKTNPAALAKRVYSS